jgi:hypothetical protein
MHVMPGAPYRLRHVTQLRKTCLPPELMWLRLGLASGD